MVRKEDRDEDVVESGLSEDVDQLVRAQRVIARSTTVAMAPRRPLAKIELEDEEDEDEEDETDSGLWGREGGGSPL